jgi:hypothetical protein
VSATWLQTRHTVLWDAIVCQRETFQLDALISELGLETTGEEHLRRRRPTLEVAMRRHALVERLERDDGIAWASWLGMENPALCSTMLINLVVAQLVAWLVLLTQVVGAVLLDESLLDCVLGRLVYRDALHWEDCCLREVADFAMALLLWLGLLCLAVALRCAVVMGQWLLGPEVPPMVSGCSMPTEKMAVALTTMRSKSHWMH